jgi:phosphoribosylglycinamide formyltransferase-1
MEDRPEDRSGMRPARVAVLVSGSGTNLQAMLDRFGGDPGAPARIVCVVASSARAGALDRAAAAGVATSVLESGGDDGETLLEVLAEHRADIIVLAGYLRMVPTEVVRRFRGRMINIHPALLPAFGGQGMYGRKVHEAVLEAGVRVTGVTVHFVDEEYDRGPIIAQWPVPVMEDDDAAGLAARVLRVEHRVLPAVVSALARGIVGLGEDGRCHWSEPWFSAERFTIDGERPGE